MEGRQDSPSAIGNLISRLNIAECNFHQAYAEKNVVDMFSAMHSLFFELATLPEIRTEQIKDLGAKIKIVEAELFENAIVRTSTNKYSVRVFEPKALTEKICDLFFELKMLQRELGLYKVESNVHDKRGLRPE